MTDPLGIVERLEAKDVALRVLSRGGAELVELRDRMARLAGLGRQRTFDPLAP